MSLWSWFVDIVAAIVAAFKYKKPKKLKRIELRLRVVDMSLQRKEVRT